MLRTSFSEASAISGGSCGELSSAKSGVRYRNCVAYRAGTIAMRLGTSKRRSAIVLKRFGTNGFSRNLPNRGRLSRDRIEIGRGQALSWWANLRTILQTRSCEAAYAEKCVAGGLCGDLVALLLHARSWRGAESILATIASASSLRASCGGPIRSHERKCRERHTDSLELP